MAAWFLTSSFFSWWSLESNSQNEWTGTSRKLASSLVWKDLRKHSLTWKRHNGGLDKRPSYWWFQSCWNIYVFDLHCCSGKVFHFPISILPWFPLHRFIYVDRNVFKTPPAVVLFVSSTDSGTDPHDFEERFLHYKMIQSSNWISSL